MQANWEKNKNKRREIRGTDKTGKSSAKINVQKDFGYEK
jgi:hypothetical protein